LALVQRDPLTRGPQLFAENCAVCHAFDGHDGLGGKRKQAASASDLAQFASRAWLTALLDPEQIATARFFGNTAHKNGAMATFVREEVAVFDPDQREALKRVIVALSAQAKLPSQRAIDERDATIIEAGRQGFQTLGCVDCHIVDDGKGRPRGPKLTDYGSRAWFIEFISNPGHGDFYGKRNDRMPAFGADGVLDEAAIGLLADWLRGQWYRPPDPTDEDTSTEPDAHGVTSSGDTVGGGG
jgi:ubiquinol-cytochrome c reductase cytochrome b subunit